ncbi:hypothetical protein F5B22DRAFT_653978 [Xylaria bambusicola]|uniref:uncharacterized protein n=1 Tax=Xylaria bambusicola TaxID=326684 RepID=UPI00200868E8|nr:uncharacterized protein F5B22DRAFT_653978 [Xylaria bambusicola]KAI0518484.1 hypothetical protein F5B22DRAFT_653978 [Xylaria bambusicola]
MDSEFSKHQIPSYNFNLMEPRFLMETEDGPVYLRWARHEKDVDRIAKFCADHSCEVKNFIRCGNYTMEQTWTIALSRHREAIFKIMYNYIKPSMITEGWVFVVEQGANVLGVLAFHMKSQGFNDPWTENERCNALSPDRVWVFPPEYAERVKNIRGEGCDNGILNVPYFVPCHMPQFSPCCIAAFGLLLEEVTANLGRTTIVCMQNQSPRMESEIKYYLKGWSFVSSGNFEDSKIGDIETDSTYTVWLRRFDDSTPEGSLPYAVFRGLNTFLERINPKIQWERVDKVLSSTPFGTGQLKELLNASLIDSEPEDGDSEDGDPEDGDPEDGDPEDGDPEDGDPEDGDPEDADPGGEDSEDGDPEDGDPGGEDSEDGDPEDGDPRGEDSEEWNPDYTPLVAEYLLRWLSTG